MPAPIAAEAHLPLIISREDGELIYLQSIHTFIDNTKRKQDKKIKGVKRLNGKGLSDESATLQLCNMVHAHMCVIQQA